MVRSVVGRSVEVGEGLRVPPVGSLVDVGSLVGSSVVGSSVVSSVVSSDVVEGVSVTVVVDSGSVATVKVTVRPCLILSLIHI